MFREKLREEWESCIGDFKAGGMTRVQWCKEHGENINKLKYWMYKIERQKRNEIDKTNWVSMIVEYELASDSFGTLQIKIGQAIIEVKPDLNPALLSVTGKSGKCAENNMFSEAAIDHVYLSRGSTDLTKSIDGLAALVQLEFNLALFSPNLFVYCKRQRDKLYWVTIVFGSIIKD